MCRARAVAGCDHPEIAGIALPADRLRRRIVRRQRLGGGWIQKCRRQRAQRVDLAQERLQHRAPEAPVPAELTVRRRPAIRIVAAVEGNAAGAVEDRVVEHVALLRERRQHEAAARVIASTRTDLQGRPHRMTRGDRPDRARPRADVVEVRRRGRERHGIHVDAVDVRDGGVRGELRGGSSWRLDGHPGVIGVEDRLAAAPARTASAGGAAVGELERARGDPAPERLVGALPHRYRGARRRRLPAWSRPGREARRLLSRASPLSDRAQVDPGMEVVRRCGSVLQLRVRDVRDGPGHGRRPDLEVGRACGGNLRQGISAVRRRRPRLRPLRKHDRERLRAVEENGAVSVTARGRGTGGARKRGSNDG